MMKFRAGKALTVGLLSALVLILPAAGTGFGLTESGSFSATCDPANYPYTWGSWYNHQVNPAIRVRNKSTSPSNGMDYGPPASSVKVVSAEGFTAINGPVDRGSYVDSAWFLKKGWYEIGARLATSYNCNGWLPGNGNYTFKYEITF